MEIIFETVDEAKKFFASISEKEKESNKYAIEIGKMFDELHQMQYGNNKNEIGEQKQ